VRVLPEEIALQVKDLVLNKPAQNPYDVLKTAVINTCTISTADKVHRFNTITLGDLRPTQLLQCMKDLQPQGSETDWYKFAFLAKMPTKIRPHLATITGNLEAVASTADLLIADLRTQTLVTDVDEIDFKSSIPKDETAFETEINAVYARYNKKPPTTKQHKQAGTCFFHKRFGNKARKCLPGCTYEPQENSKGS
jgi:hypothetical protein